LSFAATTRDDPSYAPKRVANTFPWVSGSDPGFPLTQAFEAELERQCTEAGGLRPVMNSFNDPENRDAQTIKLRELFEGLDREVLRLFGWDDLDTSYGIREQNNLVRYNVDPKSQAEIHSRLMAENNRRACSFPRKTNSRRGRKEASSEGQGMLEL
jgi:hypothetical protein